MTERRELAEKIRRGEAIDLHIATSEGRGQRLSRNLRLDEIVPLCRTVTCDDPAMATAARRLTAPAAVDGASGRVTAVIPCSRGVPVGTRALLSQDVEVTVHVLSNGEGPSEVPGAVVRSVPWRGHGQTRAEAIADVETEFVLFTVDDAIPLGSGCLRTMIEALDSSNWEAVVARQIPWPDADAVTAARLRRWTPPGQQVVAMAQTDHVATLYRTQTLRDFPLPDRPIAEDAWWSLQRRVAYVPTAPFLHSHRRTPLELYARNRAIHAELVSMGHPPTIAGLGEAVAALPGVLRPALAEGPVELANQLAEIAGQWAGALSAR